MSYTILTAVVLSLSIAFQALAAIMAIRLIAITGRHLAWILISMALVLMEVRRVVPLFHLITGDPSLPPDLFNEVIGLVLSVAMAIGVTLIAPLFTKIKRASDEIKQLALYDSLTHLPNRRLLDERLTQAIATSHRNKSYGALIFLDLDNFKPLNDAYGHRVGDLLLIEVANRLTSCVREMDTAARFGGDEFVVMLSELDVDKTVATSQAQLVAEKILSALSAPYLLSVSHEGQPYSTVKHHCTSSIGVAMFVNHKCSQDDILRQADTAMYQAKEGGRNQIRFYDANE
jgi:diguanylate cyclase (GGDEF)-like protein